jgi:electron transport complex protein RnfD
MFVLGFAGTCLLLDMPLVHHLSAGSVFFTAVYIVSDPRSMPGSKSGRLSAGLLAGVLNGVIRWHGYLPEGVVPAVLAVNLLSPTLDRLAFAARGRWLSRPVPRDGDQ